MKFSGIAALAGAAAALSMAHAADAAVIYKLSSSQFSFQLTRSDFITTNISPDLLDFDSCMNCSSIELDGDQAGGTLHPKIDAYYRDGLNGDLRIKYVFDMDAFVQPGVYTSLINHGATLTVETTKAAVPEPAAWALMILGFGAAGSGLRRRRAAQA